LLICNETLLYNNAILRAEEFGAPMSLFHHHRRIAASPDWRRLALGVIVALLMSVQGAAALAHGHGHDGDYRSAQAGPDAPAVPDAPLPGRSTPAAHCQLCHSPFGSTSILPAAAAGQATLLTVTGADRPVLYQAHPRAAPKGVWRVRGPPLSLHA
tara:strand:+ start:36834 stop:37301 length:468 start_codon:yes stop_codon:yes gene_type:complete